MKVLLLKRTLLTGKLFEDVDLQEAYNKLCKVATKDAMSVDLGLKKIASLKLDKKNLLVKLFDANELLNNVKTENMLLLDKVKNLKLELFVTREQTNRSTSSKLDQMLSVQKSPSDKTGLGFIESVSVPETHSTNFVPSSEPLVSEVVKPIEVTPPRKIRVDLQEAYNKLCKVAIKDAMIVELGLKKIASLELEKKNLLVKLFDANELLNNVKTKNMLLLDKVKNLELELSVARE